MENEQQTPSLAPATATTVAATSLDQASLSPKSFVSSTLFSPASESSDLFSVPTSKELKECKISPVPSMDPYHSGLVSISPGATRDNSTQTSPSTAPAKTSPLPRYQQEQKTLSRETTPLSENSQAGLMDAEALELCKRDGTGTTEEGRLGTRLGRRQSNSARGSIGAKKSRKDGYCAAESKRNEEQNPNGSEQRKNGNVKSSSTGGRYKRRGQRAQQKQKIQVHGCSSPLLQVQQQQQAPIPNKVQGWTNMTDGQGLQKKQTATGTSTPTTGSWSRKVWRQSAAKQTTKAAAAVDSSNSSTNGGHVAAGVESESSDDEWAIGFSQEEWEYEVGGWVVLPTGLEKTLTAQILHTYETRLFPSAESIEVKRAFIEKFATVLTEEFPELEVDIHVFGSSVNGLGTSRSDVDICLTTENRELENVFLLSKALRKYGMRTFCVPHARVPIVKAWDPELRVASDININSTIALHNTRMIQTFVAIDARVRPFVMAVKHWTKCRELNDAAFGGTLSPYAWVNVALNFLQTRNPPILPVLHPPSATLSSQPGTGDDCVDLTFNDNIDELRGFGLPNTESLGFLLYAFFRRYAYEFDYRHQVVSLRHGCTLTKAQKAWDSGRPARIFCIEEPFMTWLNLGHSANTTSVEGIRQEFKRAFCILRDGGSFDSVSEVYKRPQRSFALSSPASALSFSKASNRNYSAGPQHSRSRSQQHYRSSSSCSSGLGHDRPDYRRSLSFHPDKKMQQSRNDGYQQQHQHHHHHQQHQDEEYSDYSYGRTLPNSAETLADLFQQVSVSPSEEHDEMDSSRLTAVLSDSTLTASDYAKLTTSSAIPVPQENDVQRNEPYDGMTFCPLTASNGGDVSGYPHSPRSRTRPRIQHWHATPSQIYAHIQHDDHHQAQGTVEPMASDQPYLATSGAGRIRQHWGSYRR